MADPEGKKNPSPGLGLGDLNQTERDMRREILILVWQTRKQR